NPKVLPGVSRELRLDPGRPRLLQDFLRLLQQRPSPFRHRLPHPGHHARRHRTPDPGPPRRGPRGRLRRQPRAVPPPSPTPKLPTKAWINQPPTTIETEEQPNKKTAASCLNELDTFPMPHLMP